MAYIITRSIQGESSSRIVLQGEQMGRTFSFGSDWNDIGIGMRVCLNTSGSTAAFFPSSYFGFCAGTGSMIKDGTSSNWVGFKFDGATQYNINTITTPGYWFATATSGGPLKGVTKVGTELTTSAGSNYSLPYFAATPESHSSWIYMRITKGYPRWRIGFHSQTSYTTESYTHDMLYRDMEDVGRTRNIASPYWDYFADGETGNSSPTTTGFEFPITESFGAIDTLNIYWKEGYISMELFDFVVVRYR